MFNIIKPAFVLLLVSLTFVFIGCSEKEPIGSLSGRIVSNGTAVGDCKVALFSDVTKLTVGAKVQADGTFELLELPLGEYSAIVLQKPNVTDKNAPFDKRIPRKFRDPKTSGISIKINEGPNDIEIDLGK